MSGTVVPPAVSGSAPVVLLVATLRWPSAARLAMRFAERGCAVHMLCPREHPAHTLHCLTGLHRFQRLRASRCLHATIARIRPELVVPCDDQAAHLMAAGCCTDAPDHLLLRASLGAPDAVHELTDFTCLHALAASLAIAMPASAVIGNAAMLHVWLDQHGLPAVLKRAGSWGGRGVVIARTRTAAERALASLQASPLGAAELLRCLTDRDLAGLQQAWQRLLGARPAEVRVQCYIEGVPANRAIAAWQGEVLAGTSACAVQTLHATGPATVMALIDRPDMQAVTAGVARALGLSGLWGFDFMIEQHTDRLVLLEVNPRTTPLCGLAVQGPHLLVARLVEQLAARSQGIRALHPGAQAPVVLPVPLAAPPRAGLLRVTEIALFPGEWLRRASSHFLLDHYHDVPWHEPDFVRDCLRPPWDERGWLARLRTWLRLRAARLPPSTLQRTP